MKTKTTTKAPTDPRIVEATKLMIEAQRLLDRIVRLVEPTATTSDQCGSIGIDTFDPKDERTRELSQLSGRIGELRATYFGRPDSKTYAARGYHELLGFTMNAAVTLGSAQTRKNEAVLDEMERGAVRALAGAGLTVKDAMDIIQSEGR